MSDIDKVFLEEKEHFSNVLNAISSKIRLLYANMPYPEVSKYAVGHARDEISDLQYAKKQNIKTKDEIENLLNFNHSPYFARMDFEISKRVIVSESIYIGERSLTIDGKQYIYDWRSPIGGRYYLKNEIQFSYNSYKYKLLLRRAIKIKSGKLLSYNDEFSIENNLFSKGVSDPFLLSLLKEKREQYKLTDIIKTIQQNQNEIIRVPIKESFIVQGCAGSGKTMIMLHRLSFLRYNNPQFNFNKAKIITPNKNFNIHINELSTQLELDKIERISLKDYYIEILNKYDDKIESDVRVVEEDYLLENNFIKNIYATNFYDECEKNYFAFTEKINKTINIEKINNICDSHGMDKFNTNSQFFKKKLLSYIDFLERTVKIIDYNKSEFDKAKSQLMSLKEYLNTLENSLDIKEFNDEKAKLERSLLNIKDGFYKLILDDRWKSILIKFKLKVKLNEELLLDGGNKLMYTINQLDDENNKEYSRLEEEIRSKKIEIYNKKKILENIKMQSNKPSFAYLNKFKELEGILSLILLSGSIDKYKLKTEVDSLKEIIKHEENNILIMDELYGFEQELKTLNNKLENIKNSILNSEEKRYLEELMKNLGKIKPEISILENKMGEVNIKHKLINTRIKSQQKLVNEQYLLVENLKNKIPNNDDISIITSEPSKARILTEKFIYNNTFGRLVNTLIKKYNVNENRSLYKYKLFLLIHFHTIYSGTVPDYDNYLNFDEGQDLSPSEYKVLRVANGGNIIFNIYGDTCQLINSSGTNEWSKINEINKIFYLEENYRNTIEITNYCNTTLGLNTIPIGVSGNKVQVLKEDIALRKISGIIKNRSRVVVITTVIDKDFVEKCISLGCIQSQIVTEKVSILTVEETKGLEFDSVFVLSRNMTHNQKYIAYTRALSELTVVF